MSLFSLDVSAILESPVGTLQEFHFEQIPPEDTFSEVICRGELVMDIKLIHQSYGIECVFVALKTTIDIPDESIQSEKVTLTNQSREFHLKKTPDDSDDIQYIDTHKLAIDLTQAIEEELLIAGL
ncbi:MAG: hypothetical protein WC753_00670 [Candidatus Gracilibacteria bacterium]|jgi:hypothetical protein